MTYPKDAFTHALGAPVLKVEVCTYEETNPWDRAPMTPGQFWACIDPPWGNPGRTLGVERACAIGNTPHEAVGKVHARLRELIQRALRDLQESRDALEQQRLRLASALLWIPE